ncbi:MAG: hypothetical protein WCJ02_16880 [bacterium]
MKLKVTAKRSDEIGRAIGATEFNPDEQRVDSMGRWHEAYPTIIGDSGIVAEVLDDNENAVMTFDIAAEFAKAKPKRKITFSVAKAVVPETKSCVICSEPKFDYEFFIGDGEFPVEAEDFDVSKLQVSLQEYLNARGQKRICAVGFSYDDEELSVDYGDSCSNVDENEVVYFDGKSYSDMEYDGGKYVISKGAGLKNKDKKRKK